MVKLILLVTKDIGKHLKGYCKEKILNEANDTLVEARRVADIVHREAAEALQQRNKFLMWILAGLLTVSGFLAGTNFNGWMMNKQIVIMEKRIARAEYVIETMTGNYTEIKESMKAMDARMNELIQMMRTGE